MMTKATKQATCEGLTDNRLSDNSGEHENTLSPLREKHQSGGSARLYGKGAAQAIHGQGTGPSSAKARQSSQAALGRPQAVLHWHPTRSRFFDGVGKWVDVGSLLPSDAQAQLWCETKGVRFRRLHCEG